jgi:hypothetical protein
MDGFVCDNLRTLNTAPKSLRFTQTDCFVGNIFYKTETCYSPPRNDELQPPRNVGLTSTRMT